MSNSIVPDRPVAYDPELVFDEDTGTWIAADGSGGSRYQTPIIVVGQDSTGDGCIYFGGFPVPTPPAGAVLKDYYNTIAGGEDWVNFGYTRWLAQTFTALSAYTISSVKLKLFRSATYDPKTLTVTINLTEGDPKTPTTTILCSGTTNGSTLPTGDFEWREIIFNTPYALIQGVTYAIVISAPEGESISCAKWVYDWGGQYDGGALFWSGVMGESWEIDENSDYQFETWGTT